MNLTTQPSIEKNAKAEKQLSSNIVDVKVLPKRPMTTANPNLRVNSMQAPSSAQASQSNLIKEDDDDENVYEDDNFEQADAPND